MNWQERIWVNPAMRSGKPCIKGTRIAVYDVLEYLAGGMTEDQILCDFVGRDSVIAHPLRTHFRHRRRMLGRADQAKIVRLRSTGEVDAWVAAMLRERDTVEAS